MSLETIHVTHQSKWKSEQVESARTVEPDLLNVSQVLDVVIRDRLRSSSPQLPSDHCSASPAMGDYGGSAVLLRQELDRLARVQAEVQESAREAWLAVRRGRVDDSAVIGIVQDAIAALEEKRDALNAIDVVGREPSRSRSPRR